jgi:hypothetical protein
MYSRERALSVVSKSRYPFGMRCFLETKKPPRRVAIGEGGCESGYPRHLASISSALLISTIVAP